jgi:hypothetical protein
VKLYEYRGKTWVFINAEINEKGSLVLSGQDVGEVPEKHFGDSDYEYWVVVLEQHKDRVILVLMEKAFGGNSKAVSEFMDLMKSKGIPYEFDSWV